MFNDDKTVDDDLKSFFQVSILLLQGVPTSLGYAKWNVLKLRKICEQRELRLQNIGPLKGGNYEF